MKNIVLLGALLLCSTATGAEPFHDDIPEIFHGDWAATTLACNDPDGFEKISINAASITYPEGNDYLLIGIEMSGSLTRGNDWGTLFNGRYTSRAESMLMGEHNFRMEISERNPNVLYRYPIGLDGEAILSREARSVRCA